MRIRKFLQRLICYVFCWKNRWLTASTILLLLIFLRYYFETIFVERKASDQPWINQGFPDGGVDVVITWVNGSDSEFQKDLAREKALYLQKLSSACIFCLPSHLTATRFRREAGLESGWGVVRTRTGEAWSVSAWPSLDKARQMSLAETSLGGQTLLMSLAHWTTDYNLENIAEPNNTLLIVAEDGKPLEEATVRTIFKQNIKSIWVYNKSAVVQFNSDNDVFSIVGRSSWRYLSVNTGNVSRVVNASKVFLVLELPGQLQYSDYAPYRFNDKEELRYCLRSVEQRLGWARRIFLVTRGQIPHWLDLQTSRLTLVTHSEIFPDRSHLPTFSSSAIETHLHRIPGLSRMFLYINDDILLGQDVWFDDFFSPSYGQKVYLSWAVPDCSVACPWAWLHDGSCDPTCDLPQCSFDGGDCAAPTTTNSSPALYKMSMRTVSIPDDLDGEESQPMQDSYARTLVRINTLLNTRYGYALRKVPAHIPLLIDKRIMTDLQNTYPEEFFKTSSHKFRNGNNIQLSMLYSYYLMNEKRKLSAFELFDKYDVDRSGTWSDQEIRTLLVQYHSNPIQRSFLREFEAKVNKCSADSSETFQFFETELPVLERRTVTGCEGLVSWLGGRLGEVAKYQATTVPPQWAEAASSFNMLTTNVSLLLLALDSIRLHPKKFICLNDNLDESPSEELELAKALLEDLYQSLYPLPSKYELPRHLRNRFLDHTQFLTWDAKRRVISFLIFVLIIILVFISLAIANHENFGVHFQNIMDHYHQRKR